MTAVRYRSVTAVSCNCMDYRVFGPTAVIDRRYRRYRFFGPTAVADRRYRNV